MDPTDKVWLSDTSADTVVRFDPATEAFTTVDPDREWTPRDIAELWSRFERELYETGMRSVADSLARDGVLATDRKTA